MDEKKIDENENISPPEQEIANEEILQDNNSETLEGEKISAIDEISIQLEEKKRECDGYLDMLKRTKAEFDNYRKRTIKEKDSIYDDGFVDGIKQVLPIIDNLERAIGFNDSEDDNLLQGVELVLKMVNDTLIKNEIEEIPAEGECFNPEFHNAVMHIEDSSYENNVVVEVMQKGYKYKEKIIRYSMVKVAN